MLKTSEKGIYCLQDGRYWLRTAAKNPNTGLVEQRSKTLGEGVPLTTAVQYRDALKEEIRRGSPPSYRTGLRLSEYCKRWLEEAKPRLRPRVWDVYATTLAFHVIPELGHLCVEMIQRHHIQGWVNGVEERTLPNGDYYALQTRQGWMRVLRQVLKDMAAEFGLKDPTERIRPPRRRIRLKRTQRVLSPKGFKDLLDGARSLTPQRFVEIFVLAQTGMRPGELYALHVENIDLDRGIVWVEHSVSHGELLQTKTNAPRVITLGEQAIATLREHCLTLPYTDGSQILFPTSEGRYRNSASLYKALRVLGRNLGFPISLGPQVIRRSVVSLMRRNNADDSTVRAIVGHTSEEMTELYTGVSVSQKKEALATFLKSIDTASPGDPTFEIVNDEGLYD